MTAIGILGAQILDEWIDDRGERPFHGGTDQYQTQPLAQDWARISKVAEEIGEAVNEFIIYTGQNPRKPVPSNATIERTLVELADVVITGICAIQHFTKDLDKTSEVIQDRFQALLARMPPR